MSYKRYTVSEAAGILGVSIISIRRWTDSGLLGCERIGYRRDRRFTQQNLDDFLKLSRKKATRNSSIVLFIKRLLFK